MDSSKGFSNNPYSAVAVMAESFINGSNSLSNPECRIDMANGCSSRGTATWSAMVQASPTLSMPNSVIGGTSKAVDSRSAANASGVMYQELVPYPASCLSTSTSNNHQQQTTSWLQSIFSGNRAESVDSIGPCSLKASDSLVSLPRSVAGGGDSAVNSRPLNRRNSKKRDASVPVVHSFRNAIAGGSGSVCSDTESNQSWCSEVDEELQQMKMMLGQPQLAASDFVVPYSKHFISTASQADLLTSTKSVLNGDVIEMCCRESQTDLTPEVDLAKRNALLEGQVDTLRKELEEALRNQTDIKTNLAAAQSELKQTEEFSKSVRVEKLTTSVRLEELLEQRQSMDRALQEYKMLLDSRDNEIALGKEDVERERERCDELKKALELSKLDLECSKAALLRLEEKVSQYHGEVQKLTDEGLMLKNESSSLLSELDTLKASKEWFKEQLQQNQESRNALHQELIACQKERLNAVSMTERLKAENVRLRQEFVDVQQAVIREKELLMRHLEKVRDDVIQREAMALVKQANGSALPLPPKPKSIVNSNLVLQFKEESDKQIEELKSQLEQKSKTIGELRKAKSELAARIGELELRLKDSDSLKSATTQQFQELEAQVSRLKRDLAAKTDDINRITSQKNASEALLEKARCDKRLVDESVQSLQLQMQQVQQNFRQMRQDLVDKSSIAERLEKENEQLRHQLSYLEEHHRQLLAENEQAKSNASKSHDVAVHDMLKKQQQMENVIQVLQADLRRTQTDNADLVRQKRSLENRMLSLEMELKVSIDDVVRLKAENDNLNHQCAQFKAEFSCRDDADLVAEKDKVYQEHMRVYQSNIKLLTRKLREKMKQLKTAELALAQSQFLNSGSNNQTVIMESRSTQCEFDDSLAAMFELETLRGRYQGACQTIESLRACVSDLEKRVAMKESNVVELAMTLNNVREELETCKVSNAQEVIRLTELLEKERALSSDLRKRVFEERRRCVRLQHQVSSTDEACKQASRDAEEARSECRRLAEQVSTSAEASAKAHREMELASQRATEAERRATQLVAQLNEARERDPAIAEQIKMLSWHLRERADECLALRDNLRQVEARHRQEIDGLNALNKTLEERIGLLTEEVESARKDKQDLNDTLVDLKRAFHLKAEQCKAYEEQWNEVASMTSIPELQRLPEDEEFINRLLQESPQMDQSKKPLGQLQACLDSLRHDLEMFNSRVVSVSASADDGVTGSVSVSMPPS